MAPARSIPQGEIQPWLAGIGEGGIGFAGLAKRKQDLGECIGAFGGRRRIIEAPSRVPGAAAVAGVVVHRSIASRRSASLLLRVVRPNSREIPLEPPQAGVTMVDIASSLL